jgi:peroxiredoxin family protein
MKKNLYKKLILLILVACASNTSIFGMKAFKGKLTDLAEKVIGIPIITGEAPEGNNTTVIEYSDQSGQELLDEDDDGPDHIAKQCNKIQSQKSFVDLKINSEYLDNKGLARLFSAGKWSTLHNKNKIKIIEIDGCKKITLDGLKELPSSLEKLVIKNISFLASKLFEYLPKSLETLIIDSHADIGDLKGFSCLKKLNNLKELRLNAKSPIPSECIKYFPKSIEKLSVYGLRVFDFSEICHLKNLQGLNILECEKIKNIKVFSAEWSKLKRLSLNKIGTKVGKIKEVMFDITALNSLEKLELAFIDNLEEFVLFPKNLKVLKIRNCLKLMSLAGLNKEKDLKNLEELELININFPIDMRDIFFLTGEKLKKVKIKTLIREVTNSKFITHIREVREFGKDETQEKYFVLQFPESQIRRDPTRRDPRMIF